jgi:hypothetical protein
MEQITEIGPDIFKITTFSLSNIQSGLCPLIMAFAA